MNVFELVERINPSMCRLVARTGMTGGQRALSFEEIAARSGLGISTVKNYSRRTSWSGLPIDNVVAYAAACGVNHMQAKEVIRFIKHKRWVHVVSSRNPKQRAMFKRILNPQQPSP